MEDGLQVFYAIEIAAYKFGQALDSSPTDAFKEVFGINDKEQFEFEWVERTCDIGGDTCWGYTPGSHHIQIYETYKGIWDNKPYTALTPVTIGLILHEMGHAYNQRLGGVPMSGLSGDLLTRTDPDGFFAPPYIGQLNPSTSQSETFADMFLGWALGRWGSGQLGLDRMTYMQRMNALIVNAAALP